MTQIRRAIVILIYLVASTAHADWSVDFSRRQDQMGKSSKVTDSLGEANSVKPLKAEEASVFDRVFNTVVPTQEIVIINTEQGFIPSTIRVKEGAQYKLIVVNVNDKVRNLSFVLDSFSEHHATFFGKIKSFYINPKKEGVYTFISPETSAQGRLVVQPAKNSGEVLPPELRSPASE
jgi:hypothetical protein